MALKQPRKAEATVADGLRSYPAAMRELGNEYRRDIEMRTPAGPPATGR